MSHESSFIKQPSLHDLNKQLIPQIVNLGNNEIITMGEKSFQLDNILLHQKPNDKKHTFLGSV